VREASRKVEQSFERALWSGRLLMVVGVVMSTLMSVGAFYMATADALGLLKYLAAYGDTTVGTEARADLRDQAITLIVKSVDGYLIAAILLVFSLGLYELFINRLDAARDAEVAPKLLQVRSLEDLKQRVAGLLLLVLVIEFFQRALRLSYETPLDLLLLALGVLLIATAFHVSNLRKARPEAAGGGAAGAR
jgi:uncharacterized membrane protein YqhA